jgi:5-hydroxyisourate hydrolase-like protein (transthyretin family)
MIHLHVNDYILDSGVSLHACMFLHTVVVSLNVSRTSLRALAPLLFPYKI